MTRARGLALLATSVLLLGGCSLGKTATPTPTPTATAAAAALKSASATTFDTPVANQLTAAQAKAKLWQDDAVLNYVSVQLPTDLSLNGATDTYVYGSSKDANDWWTYSLSEKTGKAIRAIIPKEDYLGTSITVINTQYWKMNYVEAFQLADTNGGSDFRAKHTDANVTLYLSNRDPNQWLWWTIQYKTPAGDTFTLLVNPNRGEVVDTTGKQVAAPPTISGDTSATSSSTTNTTSTAADSTATGTSTTDSTTSSSTSTTQ